MGLIHCDLQLPSSIGSLLVASDNLIAYFSKGFSNSQGERKLAIGNQKLTMIYG